MQELQIGGGRRHGRYTNGMEYNIGESVRPRASTGYDAVHGAA